MDRVLRTFLTALMAVLIFTAASVWLGYFTDRAQWQAVFFLFGIMTIMYVILIRGSAPLPMLLGAAVIIRVLQVFYFPNLSDDIYRFVWDGRLTAHGFNPYLRLPSEIIEQNVQPPGMDTALFSQLNSPHYYTVYPPLMQGIYALASLLSPCSVKGAAIWIKVFHAAADCGSVWLIYRLLRVLDLPRRNALLYAFNPLVIMELSGNAHPEAIMIFFLLLSLMFWHKGNIIPAGLFFGLAVSAKLIPLLFLPALIRPMGWRRFGRFAAATAAVVIIPAVPFINALLIAHLGASLGLYFHRFEFNAGLYYLVRELGYLWSGYNINQMAAPALGFLALAGILTVAWFSNLKKPPFRTLLWSLCIYLMCSAVVHPWYLCTLVALAAMCTIRFPLWWSLAALMSYYTYASIPFRENMWLVLLEYLILAVGIVWELRKSGDPGLRRGDAESRGTHACL